MFVLLSSSVALSAEISITINLHIRDGESLAGLANTLVAISSKTMPGTVTEEPTVYWTDSSGNLFVTIDYAEGRLIQASVASIGREMFMNFWVATNNRVISETISLLPTNYVITGSYIKDGTPTGGMFFQAMISGESEAMREYLQITSNWTEDFESIIIPQVGATSNGLYVLEVSARTWDVYAVDIDYLSIFLVSSGIVVPPSVGGVNFVIGDAPTGDAPIAVGYIVETSVSYTTIQAALNAASAGQTIHLYAGTHAGTRNVGLVWPNVQDITLEGVSSVDTILDAEQITRHIRQDYAVRWQLKNLSLVRGKSPKKIYGEDNSGGSILIVPNNVNHILTIDSCIISSNQAYSGGAIASGGNSRLVMIGSIVRGNSSIIGGGGFYQGTNILINSSVHENSSTAYEGGGFYDGTNMLIDSSVYNNSARGGGGFSGGTNTLKNSSVYSNSAEYGGGFYNGTNNLINSRVYGNSVSVSGGGFVFGINSLINVLIYNNSASSQGAVFWKGVNRLVNSTIVSNNREIYFDNNSLSYAEHGNLTAYNTIFIGEFNAGGQGPINLYYCALADTSITPVVNNNPITGWTIEDVFVDYETGDYRIVTDNAFHNAGSIVYWNTNSNDVTTDILGNSRICDTKIDLGAYELQVAKVNAAPSITLNTRAITVNESEVITFSWVASDPNGDSLTVTIEGWIITNNYTTIYTDSGMHYVTVSVSDGILSAYALLRIYVINVNRVPVISANRTIFTNEGTIATLNEIINDADGDTLNTHYEWFSPTGNYYFGDTLNYKYMDYSSSGTWDVYIWADDVVNYVSQNIKVLVANVNRAPTLTLNPSAITVNEGAVINFSWTVADPDGDTLTALVISGWITINNYTTSYTDSGLHYVTVSASDGSLVATKSLRIYVNNVPEVIVPSSEVFVTSHIDVYSGVSINVNIPTNAVSEPAQLSIETTPTVSHQASFVVTGDSHTGLAITSFNFLQAVEISLNSVANGQPVSINSDSYLEIEIGLSPNVGNTRNVRIYYYNPISGQWENGGITMIAVYTNRAIFRTTHLTYFSVISLSLANQAPSITLNVNSITVYDSAVVTFDWVASDPDGDTINVTIIGWITTNNYTTSYLDIGEHIITVSVSDGQVTVDKTLRIVVLASPIEISSVIVWPNPFKPDLESINIKYDSNENHQAQLSIYSINCRLLRSLQSTGTSGENILNWDGRDNMGNSLISGLYVYLLQVEGTGGTKVTKTGKIVIWR